MLKNLSRFIFWVLSLSLLLFVVIHNINPLGVNKQINSYSSPNELQLLPNERVVISPGNNGETYTYLKGDLVYFNTKMPYAYDTAKITIQFKNNNENQSLSLGFQDREIWHYDTKLLDFPLLNNLITKSWTSVGENPTLFQKNLTFNSYDEFLNNPPINQVIGIYNFDQNIFRQSNILNYKKSDANTTINTPLRGSFSFYTYLDQEPFRLKVIKKDLNLYPDPDVLTIKIYKENDIVYTSNIDDDGITDSSAKSLPAQETYIENPGPGLPEPGVYKVVIEGNSDTVVTKIETNLNKIVFLSPIYPISTKDVYPQTITETKQTDIYTDATLIKIATQHQASEQEIKIGTESAQLTVASSIVATPSSQLTKIELPKSDAILKAINGFFAFNTEQFFLPTRLKLQNITSSEDISNLNFIISNYTLPENNNEWKSAEVTFDLNSAFIKDGKLSWILKAPGLKESGNEVIIKDIDVQLSKKPLIQL